MKAIFIGVVASFFFASTFIINRSMELGGGSWLWSASLRYIFMIPFLMVVVFFRGNFKSLLKEMRARPFQWLLWSSVGFGLFYTPITFAAAYGPGWLVSGTWQTTIIAGSLLVPFLKTKVETEKGPILIKGEIPVKGLVFSSVILVGVIILQVQQASTVNINTMLLGALPVIIAAFAYPLGNRKMMQICDGRLDTFQRVLGMTIASMPFWLFVSVFGYLAHGAPSKSQLTQSLLVAICAGVIATVLFFYATDLARNSTKQMAAVESTQSGSVIFSVLGEMIFLSAAIPSNVSLVGLSLVVIGMILHSALSNRGTTMIKGVSKKGSFNYK
ncbi:DMT family transporter [Bacillus sp. Marseille-P3661]|uniref:DMT family transporter n=1 Tax=Bacillus sp. Marseille-P3661 TaxID=1936234 RepID=UPI000C85EB20|nr:multidrug resistance efflux transporter family protein [Bacillus sp. Marseille-P3661]